MAEVPTTRKVQLTVPAADTTVTEWVDLQFSPSESLRKLIREAVAREGFVDVANRAVRPPANPIYVAESFPDDPDADDDSDDDFAPPVAKPAPSSKKATESTSAPKKAPAPKAATPKASPSKGASATTRRERTSAPPPEQPPADPSAPSIDDLLGL